MVSSLSLRRPSAKPSKVPNLLHVPNLRIELTVDGTIRPTSRPIGHVARIVHDGPRYVVLWVVCWLKASKPCEGRDRCGVPCHLEWPLCHVCHGVPTGWQIYWATGQQEWLNTESLTGSACTSKIILELWKQIKWTKQQSASKHTCLRNRNDASASILCQQDQKQDLFPTLGNLGFSSPEAHLLWVASRYYSQYEFRMHSFSTSSLHESSNIMRHNRDTIQTLSSWLQQPTTTKLRPSC